MKVGTVGVTAVTLRTTAVAVTGTWAARSRVMAVPAPTGLVEPPVPVPIRVSSTRTGERGVNVDTDGPAAGFADAAPTGAPARRTPPRRTIVRATTPTRRTTNNPPVHPAQPWTDA